MAFLIFLFLFLFSKPVFAAPSVVITNFPATVIADDIFKITFTISNADIGTTYRFKVMNDLDNNNVLTQPTLDCSSNYNSCENINIGTSLDNIAIASAKMNLISGIQNIKIRIAKDNDHNSNYDSQLVSINSILSTPTPTIISTPSPTPTPTPTIKPTATPTIDRGLYTPTDQATESAILIPTKAIEDTPSPSPSNSDSVLGENTKNKKSFLPLFFICLGGLFLLAPLILAKIKKP